MASISLNHIKKVYPGDIEVISDLNLQIKDKEFVVLVGPSGCGKSTTLRMIAGLEEISDGEMYIGDRKVNDVAPKDRDIAMVFQNYALYPHMTVYKNMAFALKLRKTPKDEIDRKVHEAAKVLDIEHLLNRKPKQLSGGQRQRVALGRAMVRDPAVFLLDEPLSNLDARLRLQTREEIRRIQKETGITTVFVTHDQEEAMSISDRIVVMKEGVIQQTGRPQEVYENPVNLFVARFLGTPQINLFEGRVEKGQLLIGEEAVLSVRGVEDQPLTVGIRPEGFLLREDGPLSLDLVRVEVMGRDISVVSTSAVSINPTVRSIIDAEMRLQVKEKKVCFAVLQRCCCSIRKQKRGSIRRKLSDGK